MAEQKGRKQGRKPLSIAKGRTKSGRAQQEKSVQKAAKKAITQTYYPANGGEANASKTRKNAKAVLDSSRKRAAKATKGKAKKKSK